MADTVDETIEKEATVAVKRLRAGRFRVTIKMVYPVCYVVENAMGSIASGRDREEMDLVAVALNDLRDKFLFDPREAKYRV